MMTPGQDEPLISAAAELLAAIRAEPVPPAILTLAVQLQALLDQKRKTPAGDLAVTSPGSV